MKLDRKQRFSDYNLEDINVFLVNDKGSTGFFSLMTVAENAFLLRCRRGGDGTANKKHGSPHRARFSVFAVTSRAGTHPLTSALPETYSQWSTARQKQFHEG